ncbi:tRNA pseudouridine synthase 1 [Elasticomyces elasticus]|nr:tRNA pseudouridine synthase 1 [Elasticomyces elasticus]
MAITNPLLALPPELVLRILEFTPLPTLNSLTQSSKAWHDFIDKTHQDAIYFAYNKTYIPNKPGNSPSSFSRYLEGNLSPKVLCERHTLLSQNWNSPNPLTSESVFQVGDDAVWRIRADFQRRFLLSTSLGGGLYVTDMDSGELIWRLPSTLDRDWDSVRPYAHLEYENGTAVFDREGNALEVWRTDVDDLPRGEFKRIAVLPHDCQTRGFHLAGGTLCVVATEGHGFVYDMLQQPPVLTRRLEIADDATGHLFQDAEVVMYSMNEQGYHFYDKASGKLLGVLNPGAVPNRCHIEHPLAPASLGRHGPTSNNAKPPTPGRLVGLSVVDGPVFRAEVMHLEEDEWGAGSLDGDLMVGLSRAGRVFVCPDWRKALQGDYRDSVVVESEYDNTDFDLGGWLSVKDHRIMFEVRDLIYILGLDDDNRVQIQEAGQGAKSRPSYALSTSSAPQLSTVPVSFMALFDDCLVSTYATLDWRETDGHIPADQAAHLGPAHDVFPTQTIRIVSFAPEVPARSKAVLQTETGTLAKAGSNHLENSERQTFILPDRTLGTGSTTA